jgi:hypothetical protein
MSVSPADLINGETFAEDAMIDVIGPVDLCGY